MKINRFFSATSAILSLGLVTFTSSSMAAAEKCGGLPASPVRVIRCYDGDTCTLSDKTKIRLAGIDAPEKKGTMGGKGQPGADDAARVLRERLIEKKGVLMSVHDKDRYGRKVGEFCIDGKSVNIEMVREGLALKYTGKVRTKTIDHAALESAEAQARAARKGIWANETAEDPSLYRKNLRETKQTYTN